MKYLRTVLACCLFGVLVLTSCVAPWFFGAWEMWWFWPYAAVLAVGVILAGLLLLVGEGGFVRRAAPACCAGFLFLAYIALRWWLGTAVFLDAERTLLLHLSGAVVALLVLCFLREQYVRPFFWCLYASLLAMATYGILNHLLAGSTHVLWAPRFEQYAGRATGPYFCPDHFAGAMELFVCMGLGLVLDRASGAIRRMLGAMACVLGAAGALMSLSRGAGMTLVVIGVLVLLWGFQQWPVPVRHAWRLVCGLAGILLLIGAFVGAQSYRERFVSYGGLDRVSAAHAEERLQDQIVFRLRRTSRGRMFAGAWRAWQTAPWVGVGPGMHRHLWPTYAAAGDGDRATGVWPALINDDFHSYEVHSDWLQLLQEHGVVGSVLFLVACVAVIWVFLRAFSLLSRDWSLYELENVQSPPDGYDMLLAGLLAIGALGFHSLGDFNLQMPGTVWVLGGLVGLGIRIADRTGERPNGGRGGYSALH